MKPWIWRCAMALLIAVTLLLAPGWTTASPAAPRTQELALYEPDQAGRQVCAESGPCPLRDGSLDEPAPSDVKLPNGKSQKDAILKAEYEQNLKDAARLVELSGQLKQDLEKNTRFVLSTATLKKTDEIEKLVKKIRSRMRHEY